MEKIESKASLTITDETNYRLASYARRQTVKNTAYVTAQAR